MDYLIKASDVVDVWREALGAIIQSLKLPVAIKKESKVRVLNLIAHSSSTLPWTPFSKVPTK